MGPAAPGLSGGNPHSGRFCPQSITAAPLKQKVRNLRAPESDGLGDTGLWHLVLWPCPVPGWDSGPSRTSEAYSHVSSWCFSGAPAPNLPSGQPGPSEVSNPLLGTLTPEQIYFICGQASLWVSPSPVLGGPMVSKDKQAPLWAPPGRASEDPGQWQPRSSRGPTCPRPVLYATLRYRGWGIVGCRTGQRGALNKSSPLCCHKGKLRPREAQAHGWVHEPGGPKGSTFGLSMQDSTALSHPCRLHWVPGTEPHRLELCLQKSRAAVRGW